MSELVPTGTVTLLLADVESSTRLWETQPEDMTAAITELDRFLSEVIPAHCGVRPVEQGEGDSFVVAFRHASDAVSCALDLQRAPLGPIRLRVGVHTGEVQLRDEANYIGPTINRTARLRDLAHGGQTVLSGTTSDLVCDRLPADAWLIDLGTHPVRDLPRPERVVQLCHPDLRNEFAPLRTAHTVRAHNLPAQLTTFVGRHAEMAEVRKSVTDNRMVTLTGAGGVGKTRLAVEVAGQLVTEFSGGVWFVDLAPITNPDVLQVSIAHTLGLPDQFGRSAMDTVLRFLSDRRVLLVLDNCEHLLANCAELAATLLAGCPELTILTTSREPIGVAGEVTWRVPSLGLADEAIELFTDRAQRARPDFRLTRKNAALVAEVGRQLDGIPLAIELAAARMRSLSLAQILDSLHDRFRLLTGGARTAVQRQQTLRASVDWSHAMLTAPERALFCRLAVFVGGFDLDAAQAVGASNAAEQYHVLDQLGLLVDKSLVVAEDLSGAMRYRLLETVRHYAREKLGESGEAEAVFDRHRDHYTGRAGHLAARARDDPDQIIAWADGEIDNLRAAFEWCLERCDVERALRLASCLQRFWFTRGRVREGLAWFDAALTDAPAPGVAREVWVKAVSDQGLLARWVAAPASLARAQEALSIARQLNDRSLIIDALAACGQLTVFDATTARTYFAEAAELSRAADDKWRLCQICFYIAAAVGFWGDPAGGRAAAEEGGKLADALGDQFLSWHFRNWLGIALKIQGELNEADRVLSAFAEQATATGDVTMTAMGHVSLGRLRASQGHAAAARACAKAALDAAAAMGGFNEDLAYVVLADAALADGDAVTAKTACEASWQHTVPQRAILTRSMNPMSEALLGCGELVAARRWADDTVAMVPGCHKMLALMVRAYIALAQNEREQAERDAYDALTIPAQAGAYSRLPLVLECLGRLATGDGKHLHAARLFGAAMAIRERTGQVRYDIYQDGYEAAVTSARDALGQSGFDAAWAEGAALPTEDAVGYAQRGV